MVAALAVVAVAAGCGSGGSGGTSSPGGSGPASSAPSVKIGLVTDIGGLNDRSFNHLAFLGLQNAEHQLGVQGEVLQSNSDSDYVPNLQTAAAHGDNLVIAVGFLMESAVEKVAKAFPNTNFAIIDSGPAKPIPNLKSLLFHEQDGGYIAGYLAGLVTKTNVVSTVGGQKIPPVDHYIAGFQAGAKAANPKVTTLNAYSQSFTNQAACKELALNQIAQHSDVVFQVAGGCGLGALSAAKEKGVWGVGVDADQSYLGPFILTSAVKKVDVAVFDTIKQIQAGTFKGGTTDFFTAQNNGAGIGKISPNVPASIVAKLKPIETKIASGQITPPDTVK
ncbi:MAG TPA: BMP family ABC transporter substrate-binding protein [Gaiellales bacterium]|nr:BMP family ABC transporter substrate-binding protein [Gaiellales bacterium]